ncbi:hypothetical protein N7468_007178 [Penicillium chermesinum]|uniref:Uncharacterized protein n=1 Tax=Penicillium chermesinum TaxID=63820 RepID=A0A9W9NW12_9EURO|nr:uncharacterized protein N7468_007178 [Penicillium chermesinum]KAJ5225953.1 hypothetical protein N7468_007178 [Penicillium chermesinum]
MRFKLKPKLIYPMEPISPYPGSCLIIKEAVISTNINRLDSRPAGPVNLRSHLILANQCTIPPPPTDYGSTPTTFLSLGTVFLVACAAKSSPAFLLSAMADELLLYDGEVSATIAGFPTIYHFQPSAKLAQSEGHKPLIVCIPGACHLGRIFYGGHEGSNSRNFLAYQLSQLGFNVLSLSYPLEIGDLMPTTAAYFRIPDWGRQAAVTTKKVIDEKGLTTRSIVLMGWSMAGRMPVPFNITAKELGLDVQQFISLSATPGISGIRAATPRLPCSEAGYFSMPPRLEDFYKQLEEMEALNGCKDIIPRGIYLREYTGGMPVSLQAYGLKYAGKGSFSKDDVVHEHETKVFDISNHALIAALYPTSILDPVHALTDKTTWGFLMTLKLESRVRQILSSVDGPPAWQKLKDLIESAPNRLCLPVSGNHFFFVGEESARGAAEAVCKLIEETRKFQEELYNLSGT